MHSSHTHKKRVFFFGIRMNEWMNEKFSLADSVWCSEHFYFHWMELILLKWLLPCCARRQENSISNHETRITDIRSSLRVFFLGAFENLIILKVISFKRWIFVDRNKEKKKNEEEMQMHTFANNIAINGNKIALRCTWNWSLVARTVLTIN